MSDVRRDFKRSTRFGIIGVFVVMAVSAAIALAFGSGTNPTGALIAILAVVFGYVAVLMMLQRRDVDRAEAKDERSAFSPTGPVDDPTTVDTDTLLTALAIKPIDQAALASARKGTFATVRSSINSGAVIMALIFFAVVPWILFQFVWSLIVFAPIIVGYSAYLTVHTIAAGGRLDQAYDASAATLEPLGLTLTERPKVKIRDRLGSPTPQADLVGAAVYEGERHGRAVTIRVEGAGATTALGGAVSAFSVVAKGERMRAADGDPAAVAAALEPLRASPHWKGASVSGGADGVIVERERDGGLHWMRDLWLAEKLADAAATPPATIAAWPRESSDSP